MDRAIVSWDRCEPASGHAITESQQQADGNVTTPEALRPSMDMDGRTTLEAVTR